MQRCWVRGLVSLVAAVLLMVGWADAGLLDGLTTHWSFDDGFASATNPIFNGAGVGNAQITTTGGEFKFGGGGLKLDGSGDFVDIVSKVFADNPDTFTISAWANRQGGNSTEVVWSTSPPYSSELSLRYGTATSARPYWFAQDVENYVDPMTVNNGSWHQYAVSWDRATGHFKYYVDGSKVHESTASQAGDTFQNTTGLHVGADRNNGRVFNGYIDDVAVWSRVLSDTEVATLGAGAGTAVPSALVAEYKFETKGGVAVTNGQAATGQVDDTAGHGGGPYHGTGTGSTLTYQADVPASLAGSTHSMDFDGGDYVDLGMPSAIADLPTGDYTIETWFKTSMTTRGVLIGAYGTGIQSINLEYHTNNNGIRLHDYNPGTGTTQLWSPSSTPLNDGEWHHAAAVRDGATARLYIDGFEVDTATNVSGSYTQSGSNMYLGRDTRTLYFDGSLDNVKFWNVARTPDQFGIRGVEQQLYRMETNAGAPAVPGAAATIVDDTAAHPAVLDGTPMNGPTYSSVTPPGIYGSPSSTTPSTVSLSFDGSNDYVDLGSSPQVMDLAQGDFTVETWIKTSDTNRANIFGNYISSSFKCVNFEIGSTTYGYGALRAGLQDGTTNFWMWGNQAVNDDQWHHVAMVVGSEATNNVRLYIDGALDKQGTYTGNPFTMEGASPALGKDRRASGAPHLNGLMDEVRISSVALDPAKFAIRGIEQGYYRMETDAGAPTTAGQAAATVDDTGIHPFTHDGTAVSGPTYSAQTPATIVGSDGQPTTKSLSFDGTSDYVELGSRPLVKGLTEGDFTIEGWINTTDSSRSALFGSWTGAAGALNLEILDGKLRGYVQGTAGVTNDIRGTTNVIDGEWHHVALVRESTGVAGQEGALLYVDGELDNQQLKDVGAYSISTGFARVGGESRSYMYYEGLMDEVRISGVALAATQFAMKGAGEQNYYRMETDGGSPVNTGQAAATVDDTGAHPFTYNGTALPASPTYSSDVPGPVIIRDGVYTTNSHSLAFNGTSDYVELGDHPLLKNLPEDNFTIEFFLKAGDTTARRIIVGSLETDPGPATFLDAMNIEIGGSTHGANQGHIRVWFHNDGSYIDFFGDTEISDDLWHHIAVVRSGAGTPDDLVTLFVDYGTDADRAFTLGQYVIDTDIFRLGRDYRGTNYYYDGLLDEFRITRSALGVDEFLVAIPEPASLSLLGLGLLALARRRRR